MQNQLLITKKEDMYLSAWAEDGRIRQIQADSLESKAVLGNIYVGKVRNVVKNINAAFIEFQKGQMGYLSLNDCKHPIHTDGVIRNDDRVLIGDEIIVQVEKEAVKTKPPTLSAKLDFSGKYIVLSAGGERVSVSRKIRDKEVRQHLHELLEPCIDNTTFGIIARTNSSKANDEELLAETQHLMKRCQDLIHTGRHRTKFSCLYQAPSGYLGSIRDLYEDKIQDVVTDSLEVYEQIQNFLKENAWEDKLHLSLWKEENGKFDAVYDLSKTLDKALKQRVWLKSGAYLVIQPTEALVSIDVNTGKAISKKKDVEKTFLKVNLEAAKEIAIQLRLRNLSGMILVDFIDLHQEEYKEELLDRFRKELSKDPVPAQLIDMTKLGLVEITRKKIRKPLVEQMQSIHSKKEQSLQQ